MRAKFDIYVFIVVRLNLTQVELYYINTTNVISNLHILRLSQNFKSIAMTTYIRFHAFKITSTFLYHHEVMSEYVHNKNVDIKFSAHRILQCNYNYK
jgi:hypothetical protein